MCTRFRGIPLILLLFLAAKPALGEGEVWRCSRPERKGPTYTDSPTARVGENCLNSSIDQAPYTRLSFDLWNSALLGKTLNSNIVSELPSRAAKQKTDGPDEGSESDRKGNPPRTSFHANEVNYTKKGRYRRRLKDALCEMTGEAISSASGPGVITITRGALTVDELRISLKKNGTPTKWKKVLKGSCRNPGVQIRLVER